MEQLLLLAVVAVGVISIFVLRDLLPTMLRSATRYLSRHHPHTSEKLGLGGDVREALELNDRVGRLIGRTAILETPITNGRGRLTIDGTSWTAEGPDMPAGSRVRIVGVSGAVIVVEAV